MQNPMDVAMKFDNYHIHELLRLTQSHHDLSFLDREDLYSLIEDLSSRLEGYYTNDMGLAQEQKDAAS